MPNMPLFRKSEWEGGQAVDSKPEDRVCVVCIQVFGGENGYMDGNTIPFMIREPFTFERLFFVFWFTAILESGKEARCIMMNIIVGAVLIIGIGIAIKEIRSKDKK